MEQQNSFSLCTEEECIICFHPLKEHDISILNCLHKFHHKCINKWFREQINSHRPKTCPCCKTGTTIVSTIEIKKKERKQIKNEGKIKNQLCCCLI